jgi:DNA-binding XRE family transcriptional regulator
MRLAQRRLEARFTQKQMAQLTGMSVMTYRRLERAELENRRCATWSTACWSCVRACPMSGSPT